MTDWGEVLISGLSYSGGVGNVSKTTQYLSQPVKANGLVNRSNGQHTLQVHCINFTGNIQIEATLSKDPTVGPWVVIPLTNTMNNQVTTAINLSFAPEVPELPPSIPTVNFNQFYSIVGQYAWIRANVTNILSGSVELVKLGF